MGDFSIRLFGGGQMGGALLRGWLAAGIEAADVTVIDPIPSDALREEAASAGFALNPAGSAERADVVVLAVKPQKVGEAADAVAAVSGESTLIVSIMAGKTLADLGGLFPGSKRIVRAMPNLPAAVGKGMTVAVAAGGCSAEDRATAERLLAGTGAFEWLGEESLIDSATGLSGSGPAYVFYLAECLTAAGIAEGLEPDQAARLARMTIAGAGEMLALSAESAAKLRSDVTSPAGTTEAGLKVLMAEGKMEDLVVRTVAAAAARARELAG